MQSLTESSCISSKLKYVSKYAMSDQKQPPSAPFLAVLVYSQCPNIPSQPLSDLVTKQHRQQHTFLSAHTAPHHSIHQQSPQQISRLRTTATECQASTLAPSPSTSYINIKLLPLSLLPTRTTPNITSAIPKNANSLRPPKLLLITFTPTRNRNLAPSLTHHAAEAQSRRLS